MHTTIGSRFDWRRSHFFVGPAAATRRMSIPPNTYPATLGKRGDDR